MAYESSSKRYQCGGCYEDFTYYQLMNNTRLENKKSPGGSEASEGAGFPGLSQLALKDHADLIASGASRVCASCELKLRLQEWNQLTAAFREANPDYATAQGVRKDKKIATQAAYGTHKRTIFPKQNKRSSRDMALRKASEVSRRRKQLCKEQPSWRRHCSMHSTVATCSLLSAQQGKE